MRTLLFGVVGSLLLIFGAIAGTVGLGLQLTNSCSTRYHVSLQPVTTVTDAPERTVPVESLSDYQQSAVENALGNGTNLAAPSPDRLEPLTEIVIVVNGERYVADIVEDPCRSLYDELAIGGFIGAIIGLFLSMYAVVLWRLS